MEQLAERVARLRELNRRLDGVRLPVYAGGAIGERRASGPTPT